MKKIVILSLFPDYFKGPFDQSMIKQAREKGILEIDLVNIRDFAQDKHHRVDDRCYGGGAGMVLMAPPVAQAIRSVKTEQSHVVYLSPRGKMLTPQKCRELAAYEEVVFLCGHYEGVDERVLETEIDEEISIGDYILTSGCAAAIVVVEGMVRFIPGVIGDPSAVENESFENGLLEYPHYTRPEVFEGRPVPSVLLSGHHEKIHRWREEQSKLKTQRQRPDLWESYMKK